MTVSVFTPTLGNRPEMLNEAIASVQAQTVPALEHIIELDNGKGQTRTMNDAMRKVKGDCFIFLADDDRLDPQFIEKTLAAMEKEQVDIVGTFLENFGGGDGVHGPGRFPFGTALCKTKWWRYLGGYDETVGPAVDADFWFMCFEKGARWCVIPDPLLKSRVHEEQYSRRADWSQSARVIKSKYHGKYE